MSLDLDILGFVAGGLVIGIAFIAQYLGQTVLQVSPGISECSLDFHFVHFSFVFFFKTIVVSDYVEYIWNGGRTFAWSIHIRNIFSIYQCSSKYTKYIYSLVYPLLQTQCENRFISESMVIVLKDSLYRCN